jgi:L-rhamnose-H+ transport protein
LIAPNPLLGTVIHGVGAFCSSIFYTPHHLVRKWSWETYWLVQATCSWLIAPIVGAFLTVPNYTTVLAEASETAMLRCFLLGAAYGIGGTAFGVSLRYIGYALTYSMAVGISTILGTLFAAAHDGKLESLFTTAHGWVVLGGIILGIVGISLTGRAGFLKEKDLKQQPEVKGEFALAKGVTLCIVAGVLSAVFNFALLAGQPVADVAREWGAGQWEANAFYPFAMGGAFLTTSVYCLWLGMRRRTLSELSRLPGTSWLRLLPNYVLAAVGGTLWYLQFFFYGPAHVRIGEFKFTSWAIHMVLLIFFSNLVGVLAKEWKSCRPRTWLTIIVALTVLIAGVVVIGYGNYLATSPGT